MSVKDLGSLTKHTNSDRFVFEILILLIIYNINLLELVGLVGSFDFSLRTVE